MLCKFKVYLVMIRYTHLLPYDYHDHVNEHIFTSHHYHFVVTVMVRTFQIYSLSYLPSLTLIPPIHAFVHSFLENQTFQEL